MTTTTTKSKTTRKMKTKTTTKPQGKPTVQGMNDNNDAITKVDSAHNPTRFLKEGNSIQVVQQLVLLSLSLTFSLSRHLCCMIP